MSKIILDLGCGKNKYKEDAIGVDILPLLNVDVVADLRNKYLPFKDNIADIVIASHIIEHLNSDDRINFFYEVYRILKPNGQFILRFPHSAAWRTKTDIQHKDIGNLTIKTFKNLDFENGEHAHYFNFKFKFLEGHFYELIIFIPMRNVRISNKHPIWIISNYLIDKPIKFLCNKFESLVYFIKPYQANVEVILKGIKS